MTEPTFEEPKPSAADSTANCESCDKNRNNIANGEMVRPQITVKSFDMPNIDADDQEVEHVVIKQEADDSCYDMCYESSQCEPTSTSERSRPSHEKSLQETTKRHEKSHHPGIENVVEKLKKNAAALQEAALPAAQKIEEFAEKPRRHYETIPKKLHFLRSCQNSLENGVDAEVSSSQIVMSEQQTQDRSGRYSPQTEDDRHSLGSSKCDTSGECLVSDNNNDSKSNNNNIKTFENKSLYEKNERNLCDITAYVKPKTVWRCEVHLIEKTNAARKLDEDVSSETMKSRIQKQKPAIDVSGLELLSNSIEQLEQRIGQSEHSQMDVEEESPVKKKLIGQQGENNNNNVGLGLLCALAEHIMEVGDKVPRKLNIDSSEEISQAGRLLLNLGRGSGNSQKDGNKRKYPESENSYSKRIKLDDGEEEVASSNYHEDSIEDRDADAVERYQRNGLPQKEKNIKHVVDVSETEVDDVSKERSVASESFNSHKRGARSAKKDETIDLQNNDARCNDVVEENNLSDSDNETSKSKIAFRQPVNGETEKRRTSVGERDARDVHDYKNTWTKSEAKKLAVKKGNRDNEDDWPNMNATELDMRVKMADIQRQYREKQKELSKLIPKKDDKKTPGRPRKKSHSSTW